MTEVEQGGPPVSVEPCSCRACCGLSPALQQAVQKQGESPQQRHAALAALRTTLGLSGHGQTRGLLLPRTDDAYFLVFLRWAKFDVAKAAGRLQALSSFLLKHEGIVGPLSSIQAAEFQPFFDQVGLLAGSSWGPKRQACWTVPVLLGVVKTVRVQKLSDAPQMLIG